MQIEVRKPTDNEKEAMSQEGIWASEVKTFPWHYDEKETCLILEGEVTVKTVEQEVSFGPGDYVIFPKGLDCTWEVKKPVKKHYRFG
ncbi:cupin domain-containing protein [Candidatus Margulisiibacteriota bacterium]